MTIHKQALCCYVSAHVHNVLVCRTVAWRFLIMMGITLSLLSRCFLLHLEFLGQVAVAMYISPYNYNSCRPLTCIRGC